MGWLDAFRTFLTDAWGPVETPTPAASVPVLREAMLPASYDPDANLTAAGGGSQYYRQLTKAARDLDPITDQRARDLAFGLYEMNPLAKRIIELTRDWVLGEGVAVRVEPERMPVREAGDDLSPTDAVSGRAKRRQAQRQEIVDRFWDDPHNNLSETIFTKVLELGLWGEQCYPVTVNPVNGAVRLGYIDPSQINAIIVDPMDATRVVAVELKATPGGDPQRFKAIGVNDDPASDSFGRMVGVLPGETYTVNGRQHQYLGACFWFAINKITSARRGRSDLLCLIDWLDAIDQLHLNEVDRAILIKSFVWDVTLTGAAQSEVEARAALMSVPKPGSLRVHNDREMWSAVSPNMNAWDHSHTIDVLLNHIAAGAGLPKTWLSGTIDVNKATAQELGEPAFKRMTARQKMIKLMLVSMASFALDQAELAGRISRRASRPGTYPAAWPIKAVMPEIRSKDMKTAADTIASASTGLVTMVDNGLLDQATGQEVAAMLANEVGVEVDLDIMRVNITAETAERERKADEKMQQQAQVAATRPTRVA